MPLVLRVEGPGEVRYRGSDLPELIEVEDRLTIGRDEKNDLVLRDEQRGISTEHCRIERIDRDTRCPTAAATAPSSMTTPSRSDLTSIFHWMPTT